MTKFEKDDVLDAIGESARKTRKFWGLSQEAIATVLGVNRTLVTLFEKGRVASFWLLYFYVRHLNMDLSHMPIYTEDEHEETND